MLTLAYSLHACILIACLHTHCMLAYSSYLIIALASLHLQHLHTLTLHLDAFALPLTLGYV